MNSTGDAFVTVVDLVTDWHKALVMCYLAYELLVAILMANLLNYLHYVYLAMDIAHVSLINFVFPFLWKNFQLILRQIPKKKYIIN